MEADIRHDGSYHRIILQSAIGNHLLGAHHQHVVTVNHMALLIHAQAAVCIPVMGNAKISPLSHYSLLQHLQMGRTAVVIDIYTIWLVIEDSHLCPQLLQNCRHGLKGRAIGTVQHNLHAIQPLTGGRHHKFDVLLHKIMAISHSAHL